MFAALRGDLLGRRPTDTWLGKLCSPFPPLWTEDAACYAEQGAMSSAAGAPLKAGEVEVSSKATRRVFTADYKERILREADACAGQHGRIGALLRREGIYWSHLTAWRKEARAGLEAKKRGPKRKADARDQRIAELERKLEELTQRAERAEALVRLHAGTSRIRGIASADPPNGDCS